MPSNAPPRQRKCPQCGAPRAEEYKPFCSRGCRDRDLLAWFGEGYRVSVAEAPDGSMDDARYDDGQGG